MQLPVPCSRRKIEERQVPNIKDPPDALDRRSLKTNLETL